SLGRDLSKRFDFSPVLMHLCGKGLVQGCAFGLPFHHFVAHRLDDLAGIANHEASRGNLFTFANEAECANDAFIAKVYVIHDHAVHSDEAVAADGGAMNNRAMSHVCALTKNGSHA